MSKKQLQEELRENNIECISRCSCGAYTVTIDGMDYSVSNRNIHKYFDFDKENFSRYIKSVLTNEFGNCNHCVNHWGLDLCACGSGEPFKTCKEGYRGVCGRPMQNIESGYNHVRGNNAWI